MNKLVVTFIAAIMLSACASASHDTTVASSTILGGAAGVALCKNDLACGIAGAGIGMLVGEGIAHHHHRDQYTIPLYIFDAGGVVYRIEPMQLDSPLTPKENSFWHNLVNQRCHTIQFILPTSGYLALGQACPNTNRNYRADYIIVNSIPRERYTRP